MMFVSRKDLALIHFVACKRAGGLDIVEPAEQCGDLLFPVFSPSQFRKPFAEKLVHSRVLCSGDFAGGFDEGFIGAECDILHFARM